MRLLNRPRTIIAVVSVAYIVLFLWLSHRHFSPFGAWTAEIEAPSTVTRLVRGPTPEYRVEIDGEEDVYRVTETPVYFEVRNPKKFDRAQLQVEFANSGPIVEAGVVKSQDPWRVESHVLYHKYLEELQWPSLKGGGIWEGYVLWQREHKYNSISEFIRNGPPFSEIAVVDPPRATYGEVLPFFRAGDLQEVNYKPSPHTYNVSLRGSQNIYLYANKDEEIQVRFLVQDMNRHDGADPVKVRLCAPYDMCRPSKGAGDYEELTDDGEEWNSQKPSALREVSVGLRALSSNVYTISFEANDDIFIRRIETAQGKMVWKNTLYFGDEVGYREGVRPVRVFSNGQGYALRTPHPESVQEVEFAPLTPTLSLPAQAGQRERGSASIMLAEHNKQYTIQMPRDVAGDVVTITTPKRDLILNSDGFFAFSRDAFFLPEPISYKSDLDLDRLGINYVLARYTPSKEVRGWRESTVTIGTWDANPATPLRVVLGTPVGASQNFEISELHVKLTKEPLTLNKIWRRIKEWYD